jgi:hypothetical protein
VVLEAGYLKEEVGGVREKGAENVDVRFSAWVVRHQDSEKALQIEALSKTPPAPVTPGRQGM